MQWLPGLILLIACTANALAAGETTRPAAPATTAALNEEQPACAFRFSEPDEPYLVKLRTQHKLDEVVAGAANDYEKIRAVSRWVRGRWRHNGQNQPAHSDPISILEEAAAGKRFRCVEYSIVASGALNALGIRARVLALKTADVETRKSGAGHVVVEAFLPDRGGGAGGGSGAGGGAGGGGAGGRWIMIDGQWDVIPVLEGKALGAVDFQRALADGAAGLGVESFSEVDPAGYFEWVGKYLFYFDARFDQRFGVKRDPGGLMLVPLGAKEPTIFQRNFPIAGMTYTHSVRAFYAPPPTVPAREPGPSR